MVEVRTPIAARLSMMAAAGASTTSPLGGCSPAGGMVSRTMVVCVFFTTKKARQPLRTIAIQSSSKFIRDDYSPWTALDVVRVSTPAMIRYL